MKFEANGNAYELKYTVNGMADLEDVVGKPFSSIIGGSEYSSLRSAFYCGLVESMPKLTLKAAGDILNAYLSEGHDLGDAVGLIDKAIDEAGFLGAQGKKKK